MIPIYIDTDTDNINGKRDIYKDTIHKGIVHRAIVLINR